MARKIFNWGVKKTIMQTPEIKERLEALNEIKFEYKQPPLAGHFSCAKLIINKKYFVVKVKTIQWLEMHLNKVLKAYNMNGTSDMYLPIAKYIHNSGYYTVKVDFICQSENPYDVIKAEFLALTDAEGKQNCLNKSFEPYVPKWNPKTEKFGWLTRNQFLNYKKLVKKYTDATGI